MCMPYPPFSLCTNKPCPNRERRGPYSVRSSISYPGTDGSVDDEAAVQAQVVQDGLGILDLRGKLLLEPGRIG